jgi:hypothetical protein
MLRADDSRRERVVARLGEGYAEGALGTQTFSLRVDRAYRARSVAELRTLTADLPLRRLRDRLGRLAETIAPPARSPVPTVRVRIPPTGPGPWTIGRSAGCALELDHETVSRHHAELRRVPAGWEVRDLGSLNGTRVNGWRVTHALVSPGDELRLGDVLVVLLA